MRCRGIKPSFFTNELLSELPFEARLLFIGLWCLADKRGRLQDRPKRIAVEIFPYDNLDCDKLLQVLADSDFIIRYTVSGDKYIQVKNFEKHQHVHHTEKDSTYPCFNGELTVMEPLHNGDDPSVICNLLSVNCNLLTDTPLPPKGEKVKRTEKSSGNSEIDAVFDAWNAMAEKHGLPKAYKDTKAYRSALNERMKESEFRDQWRQAIEAVPANPWNMGENTGGWRANFKWFLGVGQTTKILNRKQATKLDSTPTDHTELYRRAAKGGPAFVE